MGRIKRVRADRIKAHCSEKSGERDQQEGRGGEGGSDVGG